MHAAVSDKDDERKSGTFPHQDSEVYTEPVLPVETLDRVTPVRGHRLNLITEGLAVHPSGITTAL